MFAPQWMRLAAWCFALCKKLQAVWRIFLRRPSVAPPIRSTRSPYLSCFENASTLRCCRMKEEDVCDDFYVGYKKHKKVKLLYQCQCHSRLFQLHLASVTVWEAHFHTYIYIFSSFERFGRANDHTQAQEWWHKEIS